MLVAENYTLKSVYMILKLNSPTLKSSKLTLLLPIKKPLLNYLTKFVLPNPLINIIDFIVKLFLLKKDLLKILKPLNVDLDKKPKKDLNIYKINMDGIKMILLKFGLSDQKIKVLTS